MSLHMPLRAGVNRFAKYPSTNLSMINEPGLVGCHGWLVQPCGHPFHSRPPHEGGYRDRRQETGDRGQVSGVTCPRLTHSPLTHLPHFPVPIFLLPCRSVRNAAQISRIDRCLSTILRALIFVTPDLRQIHHSQLTTHQGLTTRPRDVSRARIFSRRD